MCNNEEEARNLLSNTTSSDHWPCLFTKSTTTGEKNYEEFFTEQEELDMNTFSSIGIIKSKNFSNEDALEKFESNINKLKQQLTWTKVDIVNNFLKILPDFDHKETGTYLDEKM